jgi:hypothetical protein
MSLSRRVFTTMSLFELKLVISFRNNNFNLLLVGISKKGIESIDFFNKLKY